MTVSSFPTPKYVTGQAVDALPVTTSDTTLLTGVRGLYIGTGGNIAVVTSEAYRRAAITGVAATPVVFSNMPSGSFLGLHVYKVMATSTTASNIVAMY